jgi:hypothetical protein
MLVRASDRARVCRWQWAHWCWAVVTPMNSDLENTVDARYEGPVVTVDVESEIGHDVQSDSDVLVSLESYSFDNDMESDDDMESDEAME